LCSVIYNITSVDQLYTRISKPLVLAVSSLNIIPSDRLCMSEVCHLTRTLSQHSAILVSLRHAVILYDKRVTSQRVAIH